MLTLLLVCDASNAHGALLHALSQIEPADPAAVVIDPVPHEEDGIRFYRWLSLKEGGFAYPDVIHDADGSEEAIRRYAEGGYVSPDGEGRWAVFELNANAHMLEEAAGNLIEFIDPDWGRYED